MYPDLEISKQIAIVVTHCAYVGRDCIALLVDIVQNLQLFWSLLTEYFTLAN